MRLRFALALEKNEWKDTLADITKMNQDLLRLLGSNQNAMPSTKPLKAASKHYERIREHAAGLYKALEDKLQVFPDRTCLSSHNVNLQLEARPVATARMPEELSCQIRFRVAISHHKANVTTDSSTWSQIEVELLEHGPAKLDGQLQYSGLKNDKQIPLQKEPAPTLNDFLQCASAATEGCSRDPSLSPNRRSWDALSADILVDDTSPRRKSTGQSAILPSQGSQQLQVP